MSSADPRPDRLAEQAEALATQAGAFARWATRTGTGFARRLPGAAVVESELGQLERTVLSELRRRLDNVDPLADGRFGPDGGPDGDAEENPVRAAPAPAPQTEPLRVAMAELLNRSLEQTPLRAREYLYLALLRQLVPDEARILSALADGSTYPLLHVECRTGVNATRRLLSNASTVGRAAGVAVPASVPRYIARLQHLDLVEAGEQDRALSVQYDIAMTDSRVREAEDAARAQGRARIVRATLRISPLGRELWDACHPRQPEEPVSWDRPPVPPAPAPAPAPAPTPAPQSGVHIYPGPPRG